MWALPLNVDSHACCDGLSQDFWQAWRLDRWKLGVVKGGKAWGVGIPWTQVDLWEMYRGGLEWKIEVLTSLQSSYDWAETLIFSTASSLTLKLLNLKLSKVYEKNNAYNSHIDFYILILKITEGFKAWSPPHGSFYDKFYLKKKKKKRYSCVLFTKQLIHLN